MKIFILEDDHTRVSLFAEALQSTDWVRAEDVEDAKKMFEPPYDLILLDHDLGGQVYVDSEDPNTGAAFSKWLVGNYVPNNSPIVVVHSWNHDGGKNMMETLKNIPNIILARQEFGITLLNWISDLVKNES